MRPPFLPVLPGPAADLHVETTAFPFVRQRTLDEQVRSAIQAQQQSLALIDALPYLLDERQKVALERPDTLAAALQPHRLRTQIVIPPYIRLSWRRIHKYLGMVLVERNREEACEEIREFSAKILRADFCLLCGFFVHVLSISEYRAAGMPFDE